MKSKILRTVSAAAALALMLTALPLPALADGSTTMGALTIAKDFSPNTEMYVLNDTAGESYPRYGAMYEPDGAVYYGRTIKVDNLPMDLQLELAQGLGPINYEESLDESATGFYYESAFNLPSEPGYEHDIPFYSYAYKHSLKDDQHIFMIYINFSKSGVSTADFFKEIVSGKYDQTFIRDLTTIGEMTMPVFLRLGGEMNLQSTQTAEDFKAAYNHVGKLARTYAPNAALVFSPNYGSSMGVDLDTFYPGDEYVDWVGLSLYFNEYAVGSYQVDIPLKTQMFQGAGAFFGDPLLNVQMGVNLSKLHEKPLMITEGGSANIDTVLPDRDMTEFAARRIEKAMGLLPMVYPEIKCIILSDYNHGAEDFRFYDKPAITDAYREAIKDAGVYIDDYHDLNAHKYLTPLSDLPDIAASTRGDVELYAYTFSPVPDNVTAVFYVDGAAVGESGGFPYKVAVPRDSVVTGSHTVSVQFSNGETVGYAVENGKVTEKSAAIYREAPTDWAKENVNLAIALGVVPKELQSGYTKPITRAQFCDLAVSFYEKAMKREIEGRVTFPDTDNVNVQKLASLGVVNGTDKGTFDPDRGIRREEAAKILVELYQSMSGKTMPKPVYPATYKDLETASEYARDYITKAAQLALMNGVGDGTNFEPKGSYTVEMSIVTMMRYFSIAGFNI